MRRASKNLIEGSVTFLVGLALKLFAGDVETPVVTLTKAGVVLMCIGGIQVASGLLRAKREPTTRT
ncbi:DUF5708 family protein [Streptomyces albus]|uniref:DUF5708 family protein n=1 Tax=Streptomyces sp. NRRL F-5917 TaxID=1463873 RepID=UPI0004C0C856|nr:DUF5708 family protein [Streptomyces sp. NRRL F-5917]